MLEDPDGVVADELANELALDGPSVIGESISLDELDGAVVVLAALEVFARPSPGIGDKNAPPRQREFVLQPLPCRLDEGLKRSLGFHGM